jgi:hypothetical protein
MGLYCQLATFAVLISENGARVLDLPSSAWRHQWQDIFTWSLTPLEIQNYLINIKIKYLNICGIKQIEK